MLVVSCAQQLHSGSLGASLVGQIECMLEQKEAETQRKGYHDKLKKWLSEQNNHGQLPVTVNSNGPPHNMERSVTNSTGMILRGIG